LSTQASVRDQSAPGSYDSLRDVNGSTTRDFDINPFNYVNTIEPYVLMMIMATMNTTEITAPINIIEETTTWILRLKTSVFKLI
jgi:hypothetical protein